MPAKPTKPSRPSVPVAFPELEEAMRVIVGVPKAEVDAAIARQKALKKSGRGKK